jgi:RNA polymerase sigma factor (TIGR02999 family)
MDEITRLLDAARDDPRAADQLLPLVYAELRRLAAQKLARERPGQTLDATALVHEAYLRLVASGDASAPRDWQTRGHFFAAAAEAMRRILVERARRKRRRRHGGGLARHDLDPDRLAAPGAPADLLALDEALDRLAAVAPRAAELVKLRYFAGLTVPQAAAALGVAPRTADADWAYARAWLLAELRGDGPGRAGPV